MMDRFMSYLIFLIPPRLHRVFLADRSGFCSYIHSFVSDWLDQSCVGLRAGSLCSAFCQFRCTNPFLLMQFPYGLGSRQKSCHNSDNCWTLLNSVKSEDETGKAMLQLKGKHDSYLDRFQIMILELTAHDWLSDGGHSFDVAILILASVNLLAAVLTVGSIFYNAWSTKEWDFYPKTRFVLSWASDRLISNAQIGVSSVSCPSSIQRIFFPSHFHLQQSFKVSFWLEFQRKSHTKFYRTSAISLPNLCGLVSASLQSQRYEHH